MPDMTDTTPPAEGDKPQPDPRQLALGRMADNARELGLDYEPMRSLDPKALVAALRQCIEAIGALIDPDDGEPATEWRAAELKAYAAESAARAALDGVQPSDPAGAREAIVELWRRIEGFVPFEQAEYLGGLKDAALRALDGVPRQEPSLADIERLWDEACAQEALPMSVYFARHVRAWRGKAEEPTR
jgi:hypothetical protein